MKRLLSTLLIIILTTSVFAQELYKTEVVASFYGEELQGKKTSSGEAFDMNGFTCAHKELPFDTILKVTNLANGKSVNVRVNDRGPFVTTREIDLSKAAAQKLDMIKTGTAKVKIEIIQKGPDTKISLATAKSAREIMAKKTGQPIPADEDSNNSDTPRNEKSTTINENSSATNVAPGKVWDIQVASFKEKDNATAFAKRLSKDGFKNIVFQSNDKVIRVVVSKVPSDDVPKTVKELESKGYAEYVIRERKK